MVHNEKMYQCIEEVKKLNKKAKKFKMTAHTHTHMHTHTRTHIHTHTHADTHTCIEL